MSVEDNPNPPQATELPPDSPAEPADLSPEPAEGEIGELMAGVGTSGLTPGQVVKGTVLKVTDEEVYVDIGLKSEGAIARAEFVSRDGELKVKPGDVVDVWVEEYDEAEGTFSVSHQKAAQWRAWDDIERAFQERKSISGRVTERTKGGLTVDISGVRAFLPGSQSDLRSLRDLDSLIGQEISCHVLKLNKSRNNVVVSRKAALEEEAHRLRAELLEHLEPGKELAGRVKNLTSYGAFVDLGGLDGLLHVTDLSWGRVGHPSEVVRVGQELRVKVLKYEAEKGRVSLGLKQLTPDPWEHAPSLYHPGDRYAGRVVSLTDYGAFVELEAGVEGLIHVSEMSWSKRLRHPSKILKVGDPVEVAVLEVDSAKRRISLSLRQTLQDPWSTLTERLAVGSTVEGRVRNITDFGAFVELEEGVDALIHVSDLSWTKHVRHASEILKKGQKVQGVILSLDPANRRISMGIKQLQPDIWDAFFATAKVGDIVRGRVARLAQFGAFVELREGIEGLCHMSEMEEKHKAKGSDPVQVGKEFDFCIVRLNPGEKRIALSLKDVHARPATDSAAEPAAKAPARAEPSLSPFAAAMHAALASPVPVTPTKAEAPTARSEPSVPVAELPTMRSEPEPRVPVAELPTMGSEPEPNVPVVEPPPTVRNEPEASVPVAEPLPTVRSELEPSPAAIELPPPVAPASPVTSSPAEAAPPQPASDFTAAGGPAEPVAGATGSETPSEVPTPAETIPAHEAPSGANAGAASLSGSSPPKQTETSATTSGASAIPKAVGVADAPSRASTETES